MTSSKLAKFMDIFLKTGRVSYTELSGGAPIVLCDYDYESLKQELKAKHLDNLNKIPFSGIEWAMSGSPVITFEMLDKRFGYGTKYLDFDDAKVKEYRPKSVVLYSFLEDKIIVNSAHKSYAMPVVYLGEL